MVTRGLACGRDRSSSGACRCCLDDLLWGCAILSLASRSRCVLVSSAVCRNESAGQSSEDAYPTLRRRVRSAPDFGLRLVRHPPRHVLHSFISGVGENRETSAERGPGRCGRRARRKCADSDERQEPALPRRPSNQLSRLVTAPSLPSLFNPPQDRCQRSCAAHRHHYLYGRRPLH